MSESKQKVFRAEVDRDNLGRLDYIRDELGLSTRKKALEVAIIATYENMVDAKLTEIDPLLPITVRLDEITEKLDLVLPEI